MKMSGSNIERILSWKQSKFAVECDLKTMISQIGTHIVFSLKNWFSEKLYLFTSIKVAIVLYNAYQKMIYFQNVSPPLQLSFCKKSWIFKIP